MKKRYLFIIIILLPIMLFSQQKDIKVGLVLSGGGAKGMAHVSALKVIEEAGVRIDYIGGTSFGAIVGSLYASGYSAEQIDSIVKVTNLKGILYGDIIGKNKYFQKRELGKEYILSIPVVDFKLGLPTALTYGQGFQNLITTLTKDANYITDFSKLPIPFLCIATNLETGEKEVLKDGFLPEAVRASSAFPTLIPPVKIDNKLLIDGGLVDNFPVEEVRKMGADVIIGVNVQSDLKKDEELTSIPKILNQIINFQIYENIDKKNAAVDILIEPDVKKFSVVDFDKKDIMLKEGKIAAQKKYNELLELAKRQLPKKKKPKLKPVDFIKIKDIQITGNNIRSDKYIKSKLRFEKNDIISYKELSESINRLFGTEEFKHVQYEIKKENDESVLIFNVKENPVKTYIDIAINHNHLYKAGALLGVTSKSLLFKNDILSANVVLGNNLRYNFDYFVDNGQHWSFGGLSRHRNFSENIRYNDDYVNNINIHYREYTNQLYTKFGVKRKGFGKIGIEHSYFYVYTNTINSLEQEEDAKGKDRLILENSNYIKLIGNIVFDTYDNNYFPKSGFLFKLSGKWFLYSSNNKKFNPFFKLYGRLGFAVSPTAFKKLSINTEFEAGSVMGNQNAFFSYVLGGYERFKIPSLISFYGYDYFTKQMTTNLFLKTTVTSRYEIFKNNYLRLSPNLAFINIDKVLIDYKNDLKIGFLLGYELDSFLGPICINYSWNPEEKKGYWYFNLGFWF